MNNKGNDAKVILEVGVDESKLVKQFDTAEEMLSSIKVEEKPSKADEIVDGLMENVERLVQSSEEREYLLDMQQEIIEELQKQLERCNSLVGRSI